MPDNTGEVTLLLRRLGAGEKAADSELFQIVYQELRRLAGHYMRSERQGHTLQPTALVHEAYAAILGGQSLQIKDRSHFMAIASRAMRRVLVDHARARAAYKREHQKVSLDGVEPGEPAKIVEILTVNNALEDLRIEDPLQAQIVELRYFGGMSVEETAQALSISTRTVKRKWSVARLWLYDRLSEKSP